MNLRAVNESLSTSFPGDNGEPGVLIAMDFDMTEAQTFETSPNGVDVNYGYQVAIDAELGLGAVNRYIAEGGHNNRTPAEIVQAAAPDMTPEEVTEATPRIIRIKLDVLTKEVGAELPDGSLWPRPTDGLLDFWDVLQQAQLEGHKIDTAVLSAGHTEFIARFHELYDLPMPDILITDDVLATFNLSSLPPVVRAKPSPLMMTLAMIEWVSSYGYQPHNIDIDSIKSRVIYVGDDDKKDRGLAENSGVEFVHIPHGGGRVAWQSVLTWAGIETPLAQQKVVHA